MKKLILSLIKLYQHFISPDTGILKSIYPMRGACRFKPTCSDYMYQAINRYGIIVGLWKGFKRVIRCNPWNKGGWDPVE